MAAYGTKKPRGDAAVQLTFPTVFSEVAAAEGLPQLYVSEKPLGGERLPTSTDMMAQYHEQKRREANARALNGVRDTKMAIRRYLTSPHGYYDLPAPVRTQRIFANPSNGTGGIGGDIYPARRDNAAAPFSCRSGMTGGVLRTAEGQKYGRQLLRDRLRQLDAIDVAAAADKEKTAAEALPVPLAVEQGLPDVEGVARRLEVVGLLGQISDAFDTGIDAVQQLTARDVNEFIQKIIGFATIANRQELEEIIADLDSVIQNARGLLEDAATAGGRRAQVLLSIAPKLVSVRNYLRIMYANVNRPLNERKKISITAVKDTKLTSLRAPTEAFREVEPQRRTREDDEAAEAQRVAGRRPEFEVDNRQRFGRIAGAFEDDAAEGLVPDGDGGEIVNEFRAPAARVARRADRELLAARMRQPAAPAFAAAVPAGVGDEEAAPAGEGEGEEAAAAPAGEGEDEEAAPAAAATLPNGTRLTNRAQLAQFNTVQLRDLTEHLRATLEGFTYVPRADSDRASIRRRIIDILGL